MRKILLHIRLPIIWHQDNASSLSALSALPKSAAMHEEKMSSVVSWNSSLLFRKKGTERDTSCSHRPISSWFTLPSLMISTSATDHFENPPFLLCWNKKKNLSSFHFKRFLIIILVTHECVLIDNLPWFYLYTLYNGLFVTLSSRNFRLLHLEQYCLRG